MFEILYIANELALYSYTGINTVLAHFLLAKSKSVWFGIFHSHQYAGAGDTKYNLYELALRFSIAGARLQICVFSSVFREDRCHYKRAILYCKNNNYMFYLPLSYL